MLSWEEGDLPLDRAVEESCRLGVFLRCVPNLTNFLLHGARVSPRMSNPIMSNKI